MDILGKGLVAFSTVALLLGPVACAAPPEAQQEKAVQDATELQIRQAQERAATILDAAAATEQRPLETSTGYAELSPGPALTEAQILEKIQALAVSLQAAADSDPENLQKVLALTLPPDARNDRRGVTGRIGEGSYSWAVWDAFPHRPGQFVQLRLSKDACLSFPALKSRLEADGFTAYVPPFPDDPRITFDRHVAPSLSLFVAVMVDTLEAPACFTTVDFKLGPSHE